MTLEFEDMTEENLEELEPIDYFNELKTKITEVQLEQLEQNRAFLAKELEKAKRLGQKNLTHKSSFMWEILEKAHVSPSLFQGAFLGPVFKFRCFFPRPQKFKVVPMKAISSTKTRKQHEK